MKIHKFREKLEESMNRDIEDLLVKLKDIDSKFECGLNSSDNYSTFDDNLVPVPRYSHDTKHQYKGTYFQFTYDDDDMDDLDTSYDSFLDYKLQLEEVLDVLKTYKDDYFFSEFDFIFNGESFKEISFYIISKNKSI